MSRSFPVPDPDRTVHLIGDMHMGGVPFTKVRQRIVADDMARGGLPAVKYRLQLGDMTQSGGDTRFPPQDANAVAYLQQFGATQFYTVGNHDMFGGRSAQDAALALGMVGKDYTVDLGFAQLTVIGPDLLLTNNVGMEYHAPTLDWLDGQLAAATKPVIIAAHPPLMNTEKKLSNGPDFSAQPDADIRAVLAAHSADKTLAWVSGHTHSPISTVDLIKVEPVGSGEVLALNTSTLANLSGANAWTDHLITFWLTVHSDRWEVRFRDHGAHQWVGGSGGSMHRRVWTIPF